MSRHGSNIFCSPTAIIAGPGSGDASQSVTLSPSVGSIGAGTQITLSSPGLFTNNGDETLNLVGANTGTHIETPPIFVSANQVTFTIGGGYVADVYTVVYGNDNGSWTVTNTLTVTA